ncbi:conserved secreted protein [Mycobacterium tuberculosis T92]|nr:conserved secreted protein [Mycobacterium tuberculosis T92]
MSAPMIGMVVLVVVLGLAVLALSYRLWKLRQGGTAGIMRDIPAVGGHGWRHGVIRYRGGEAAFYRLSSLRLWPDRRLSRRGVEIISRRRAPWRRIRHHDRRDCRCGTVRQHPGPKGRLRDRARQGRVDRISVVVGVPAVAARAPP